MDGHGIIESEDGSQGGNKADLIDVGLNPPSVLPALASLSTQLESKIKSTGEEKWQNLNALIQRLSHTPAEFNFTEYEVYLDNIDQYTRINTSAALKKRQVVEKLKSLLLCFGFYVACEDLLNFAREKAIKEEKDWPLGSGLATDAEKIVHEFQYEFNPNKFDPDMLREKIEILWRIKKALHDGFDQDNYNKLGILAERSNSKSCWYFFLGLVMFAASIFIIIATQGAAIPYLKALVELSMTGKTVALVGGILGSEAGVGIMWWQQQKPYSTAFCCFWHKMKKERETEQEKERLTASKQSL